MRQLVLDMVPNIPARLDNFVPGRNGEVLQALQEWREGCGAQRCLYLWGNAGAGKTHLVQALAAALTDQPDHPVPVSRVSCTSSTRFAEDPAPFLLVDDVDRLDREGALSLFHRYNERQDSNGSLLVTGPCPPAQLTLPPELTTRLGWGLVLRLHALTDAEKMAALCTRAAGMGVTLAPEAAHYLLSHWTRDLPALLALVAELERHALSAHRPAITIPLIRDLLNQPHRLAL